MRIEWLKKRKSNWIIYLDARRPVKSLLAFWPAEICVITASKTSPVPPDANGNGRSERWREIKPKIATSLRREGLSWPNVTRAQFDRFNVNEREMCHNSNESNATRSVLCAFNLVIFWFVLIKLNQLRFRNKKMKWNDCLFDWMWHEWDYTEECNHRNSTAAPRDLHSESHFAKIKDLCLKRPWNSRRQWLANSTFKFELQHYQQAFVEQIARLFDNVVLASCVHLDKIF